LHRGAGEPIFGEFTVYPRSGLLQFDRELGAHWDIGASGYLSRLQPICPTTQGNARRRRLSRHQLMRSCASRAWR
jgi:hypothetical protein